jgi:hypothetical protein
MPELLYIGQRRLRSISLKVGSAMHDDAGLVVGAGRSPLVRFLRSVQSTVWIPARFAAGSIRNLLRRQAWSREMRRLEATSPNGIDPVKWGQARRAVYERWGAFPCTIRERRRTQTLKDRYKGHRIFLIGNGPSLNQLPLEMLAGEYTFGVNRIYLLFDRISWRPTFYTVLDWRVGPDIAHEVNLLDGMTFFIESRYRGLLRGGTDTYWYQSGAESFAYDATKPLYGGGTVMLASIQLAYYMGFNPIYLIGVDASYSVPDSVLQEGEDRFGTGVRMELTSTRDDDANHFDPRYFGAGRRWHDPNVKGMVAGFTHAREALTAKGVRIYNAGVGGKLEVFERVDFESLFA